MYVYVSHASRSARFIDAWQSAKALISYERCCYAIWKGSAESPTSSNQSEVSMRKPAGRAGSTPVFARAYNTRLIAVASRRKSVCLSRELRYCSKSIGDARHDWKREKGSIAFEKSKGPKNRETLLKLSPP